jgi:hypothetical protein
MSEPPPQLFQQATNTSRPSFIWRIAEIQHWLFEDAPSALYPFFVFRNKGGPFFFSEFGCFPCELRGKEAGKSPNGGNTLGIIDGSVARKEAAIKLRSQALREHKANVAKATLVLGVIAVDVGQSAGFRYTAPQAGEHSMLILLSRKSPRDVWDLSYVDFLAHWADHESTRSANNAQIAEIWNQALGDLFPAAETIFLPQATLNWEWGETILEEKEGGYCWTTPALGILMLIALGRMPPPVPPRGRSGHLLIENWKQKHFNNPLLVPFALRRNLVLLIYFLTGKRIPDSLQDAAFAAQQNVDPTRAAWSPHLWHWNMKKSKDSQAPESGFQSDFSDFRIETLQNLLKKKPTNLKLCPYFVCQGAFVTEVNFAPHCHGTGPATEKPEGVAWSKFSCVLGLVLVGLQQHLCFFLPATQELWFLDFGEAAEEVVLRTWNALLLSVPALQAVNCQKLQRPRVSFSTDLNWKGPVIGLFLLPVVCRLQRKVRSVAEAWNATMTAEYFQPQADLDQRLLLYFLTTGDFVPSVLSWTIEDLRRDGLKDRVSKPLPYTEKDLEWIDLDLDVAQVFAREIGTPTPRD